MVAIHREDCMSGDPMHPIMMQNRGGTPPVMQHDGLSRFTGVIDSLGDEGGVTGKRGRSLEEQLEG